MATTPGIKTISVIPKVFRSADTNGSSAKCDIFCKYFMANLRVVLVDSMLKAQSCHLVGLVFTYGLSLNGISKH